MGMRVWWHDECAVGVYFDQTSATSTSCIARIHSLYRNTMCVCVRAHTLQFMRTVKRISMYARRAKRQASQPATSQSINYMRARARRM